MKYFCTLLLVLFVNSVQASTSVSVASRWLLPNPKKRAGEITQERTKPILTGDIIYSANLSGTVTAVHRTEGYIFWQKQLEAGVEGALGYGRSKIVIGDLQGGLIALNARDGSEAWPERFKIQTEWHSAPVIVGGKVFATSSNDEIFALSETTGKEVWHYAHRGDEKMTVRGMAPPVVYGTDLFQGFSDGTLVALSTANGKVLWTKKLRSKDRFYDVDATPYVDEKSVIAATFDGKIYHLDRLTGNTQWIHSVGSYGGFLVEEDRLYFAGLDGNFYAVSKDSGTPIWKTPFEGVVGMAPVRAQDQIVFTTSGDFVYLLDPQTGKVASSVSLATGTLASPVASPDGWFYVLSNYGNLFSFQVLKNTNWGKTPGTIASPSAIERNLVEQTKNLQPS